MLAKTDYMLISSPRHHPMINIDNIEQEDYVKCLGVFVDN